jgi:hypothetical protein
VHRSGTSAYTSAIAALGLTVGDENALLAPDENNPRGYWEPAKLVDLNDRILACWRASWFSPRLWERPDTLHGLPEPITREMADFVAQWSRAGKPWVWKDPRLCITYRYWAPLLPKHVLVIVERDPREIAASLATRDELTPLAAIALWEVYARAILVDLVQHLHIVVRYQDLIERATDTLKSLADFLNASLGIPLASVELASARVEPSLRHKTSPPPDVYRLTRIQQQLHQRLRDADSAGLEIDDERKALLDACLQEIECALRVQANLRAQVHWKAQFEALEARRAVRLMHWIDGKKEQYRRRR